MEGTSGSGICKTNKLTLANRKNKFLLFEAIPTGTLGIGIDTHTKCSVQRVFRCRHHGVSFRPLDASQAVYIFETG